MSGKNARVSVIIASYNHEKYIENCLSSVLKQCKKSEISELVVVDDGSSDCTYDTVLDFTKKFKNSLPLNLILAQNSANRGAHFTWNRAVSMATGDYIFLLNSDDEFDLSRIWKFVGEMERSRAQWAFSGVKVIDRFGNPHVMTPLVAQIQLSTQVALSRYPSVSWGFLDGQMTASTGNLAFRRSLWEKVGGFRNLKYCHDWDFALRASCFAEPLFIPDELYRYRIHEENTFSELNHLSTLETYKCIKSYFDKAMNSVLENKLAPSPINWPTAFYKLAELTQTYDVFKGLYLPYEQHHRIMID